MPAVLHACISRFPLLVLQRWGRRQGCVLSYLEESSLKWATVIHQLPSFPWRPSGSAHTIEIPQDSALFLYLRFILFPSLCISLSVSLRGSALCFYCGRSLSALAVPLSLISSFALVFGDDFLLDTNSNFSFIVSLLPPRLYIQSCISLHYCLSAPTAAMTPFPLSVF